MRASGQAVHPEYVDRMLQEIDAVQVRSWFDVGLFLDRLRDRRKPPADEGLSADQLMQRAAQHAACLDEGPWQAQAPLLSLAPAATWPGAERLFQQALERGSAEYNALIGELWPEVRAQAEAIGRAVAEQQVEMLICHQAWSQPAQLPRALALICVCETLHLPVVSVHTPLAADCNRNRHLGEIHTLIESVFPWDSPWAVHLTEDQAQTAALRDQHGINPARIQPQSAAELSTCLRPVAEYAAGDGAHDAVVAALAAHRKVTRSSPEFEQITRCQRRRYLPGLTELEYMIRLDSLIDPNAFRAEEKLLRGRCFAFAEARLEDAGAAIPSHGRLDFLAAVEYLFDYHVGTDELVVDHSLSYRHRNTWHYPYRKLTECELLGVVGKLAEDAATGTVSQEPALVEISEDFTQALEQTIGAPLTLDHSARLRAALASDRPLAWLPNADDWRSFGAEAALLAAHALASRQSRGSIRLLCRSRFGSGSIKGAAAYRHLGQIPAWAEAMQAGRLELVEIPALAQGTHLGQLGDTGEAALREVQDAGGFVLSFGHANLLCLDLLNMESFRLGRCGDPQAAAFMDLPEDSGYALWVPAALRPSLAYPTPIQTPRAFSEALLGKDFAARCREQSEATVLQQLAEDADQFGTPIAELLSPSAGGQNNAADTALEAKLLTGIHDNGAPWSGAYLKLPRTDQWQFATVFAQSRSDTVLDLIQQHQDAGGAPAQLAWNGGYILNPELVGKLGLPEDYIGTPLGLLIDQGEVRALPLFNKPALAFGKDGRLQIREANLNQGLSVRVSGGDWLRFDGGDRNLVDAQRPVYYDLMHGLDELPLSGRVAYRFAGRQIISVHENLDSLPTLPVGLTVVLPADQKPAGWVAGAEVEYQLPGWEAITDAIEAGPKLVRDGQISIEMEQGGWKSDASIRTQAARLDYTHMRGPKIGVGLGADGELLVVAINGRIRESVGATHSELAKILQDMGAEHAMGFDPGGSVTLVVNGRQLNISPYNRDYMTSPLSLPPQPRFVGNAIVAAPRG